MADVFWSPRILQTSPNVGGMVFGATCGRPIRASPNLQVVNGPPGCLMIVMSFDFVNLSLKNTIRKNVSV
jgi:hypothetical protein